MFKARLIENSRYYKLISKHLFLLMVFIIAYFFVVNFVETSKWSVILECVILIAVITLIFRNNKMINVLLSRNELEIINDHIRVIDKNEYQVTEWDIHGGETVRVNKEFILPNHKFPEILKTSRGNPVRNYIEFKIKNDNIHLKFHLDSDHLRIQLDKLVDSWMAKEVNIEQS